MTSCKSKSSHGCVSVDALLGMATADALGVPVEFMSRDELILLYAH